MSRRISEISERTCTVAVRVAVEGVLYQFDREYTYLCPEALNADVVAGVRVNVPFGRGNRKHNALVLSVFSASEITDTEGLKQLSAVLDKAPLFDAEMLSLVKWLSETTFSTLYEAAKAVLPPGIGLKDVVSYVSACEGKSLPEELGANEREVLNYLTSAGIFVKESKLFSDLGIDKGSVDIPLLLEKGLILSNSETVRRTGDLTVKNVALSCSEDELDDVLKSLTAKQRSVMSLLRDIGSASVKEVCYFTGVTQAVINGLYKKGLVYIYDCPVFRTPAAADRAKPAVIPPLTDEQQRAFSTLLKLYNSEKPECALLFGVTGSGKTQVFLNLIDKAVAEGRGVIAMVPEIALTPQALSIFYSRYGEKVAVFHSALSAGERLDEWKRVKNGEALIALGTRSAVFAPVKNLGLIVMDEEQEHTYKSEMAPKYHAREVAKKRCAMTDSLLLLASATPSLETYKNACDGRYTLVTLSERYGEAVLPQVITVDMNDVHGCVSTTLFDELESCLASGKQAILLMNRRGFNTFASCKSCGKVLTCPNCSISLTYHKANNRFMCHYCGYSLPAFSRCPECGENALRFAGTGTQKIEEELEGVFPDARIVRMDADTTGSKYSYEAKLSDFSKGKYDILLGTQMVAKGLDFPNVTLVGVISVDAELYSEDFRSAEKAFDLVTQVVGRSGRGDTLGRAVIQTVVPDNEIITLAAEQDYTAFYETEIALRRAMMYPPFCDIVTFTLSAPAERRAYEAAVFLLEMLKTHASAEYSDVALSVIGPAPPRVSKLNMRYRQRLSVKCRCNKRTRELISLIYREFRSNAKTADVLLSLDVNPLE